MAVVKLHNQSDKAQGPFFAARKRLTALCGAPFYNRVMSYISTATDHIKRS